MKKTFFILTVILAGHTVASAQAKGTKNTSPSRPVATTAKPVVLKNATDSASYALGILIAKNLKAQGIDSLNPEILVAAIREVSSNKTSGFTDMQAQTIANNYAMACRNALADENLKKGEAFLETNKKKKGVITTASGLQYEVLVQGPDGPKPGPTSKVKAHYHGTLVSGKVFDSSVQRGQPLPVSVNGVIKAWTEALQMMTVGTKLRIYCPANLAYGPNGSPPNIGPNEVLIFEMELISIDQP